MPATADCDRCQSCYYHDSSTQTCGYYFSTGYRRPCPVGEDCAVYKSNAARRAISAYAATRGGRTAAWDVAAGFRLWSAGATDAQIAAAVGTDADNVGNFRRRHWGQSNGGHAPAWDVEKARALYATGASDRAIGEAVGCTGGAFRTYRINHDWPRRAKKGKELEDGKTD